MKILKRLFIFIWPPYEAHIASKYINTQISEHPQKRLESIQSNIKQTLSIIEKAERAEPLAHDVYDSEMKRKETIESKAQAFMFAFSICIGILSILPALFGAKWNIPNFAATVSAGFYVLAMLHLIVAIYHSIQARRISGFALPSADECLKSISDNRVDAKEVIVMHLSKVKFNEPILTKKANSLVVAETMFIRAVIFLVIASCISIIAKIYITQS